MLDDIYCISQVSFPERIQEIGALRIRAWREEPGINADFFAKRTWIEAIDYMACHWIITKNDRIVAAARMSFHDSLMNVPYASLLPELCRPKYTQKTLASINRLVVDPRFRGLGLARQLDQARLNMAREKGVDYVLAQPQQTRLSALTKQGFQYVCELPHIPEMPDRQLFFMELAVEHPVDQ